MEERGFKVGDVVELKSGVLSVFIDSVSQEARIRYFEDALKI